VSEADIGLSPTIAVMGPTLHRLAEASRRQLGELRSVAYTNVASYREGALLSVLQYVWHWRRPTTVTMSRCPRALASANRPKLSLLETGSLVNQVSRDFRNGVSCIRVSMALGI
jgi:hypothetical protein